MDRNYYLEHHGIKGMKWGVRRTAAQLGHAIKKRKLKKQRTAALEKARAAKAEKAKQVAKYEGKPKAAKYMSEAELNKAIARMELEKRYIDLLRDTTPKEQVSRGRKFVTDVLENSGKNIATQATTFALGYGANKVLEKIFDDPQAINPKKGQKDK